jgi:hypothetical protein
MAIEPDNAGRAEGEGEDEAAGPGDTAKPRDRTTGEALFPNGAQTTEQADEDAEWSALLESARTKAEADEEAPAGVPGPSGAMPESGDEMPDGQPPLPQSAVIDALADDILPALERRPPGGARKAWAFVGIIVLAVGFAASAWYALRPQAPMMADAQPPLFKAEVTPIKVKPAEPGGLKVPNQDKLVYESLSGKKPAAKVVKLAPAPEKPVKKPTAVAPPAPAKAKAVSAQAPVKKTAVAKAPDKPAPGKAKMERLTAAVQKVTSPAKAPLKAAAKTASVPAPKATEVAKAAAKPAPPTPPTPKPVSAAKTASAAAAKPAAKSASAATPAAPAKAVAKVVTAKATAKTAAAAPSAPSAPSKVFRVQLLSARNAAGAKAEYLRLKKKYAALLGPLAMDMQTARIKGKGTYYRIRVGAFDSAKAAGGFCAKLTKAGQGCLIARP